MNSVTTSTKRQNLLKRNKSEMKNTITEILKNTLEGINSISEDAEEEISDLVDRAVEITHLEQQKKKKRIQKNEDSLRVSGISSILTFHYRGPRRRRDKGKETLFEEIMSENFPNLRKETNIQVQEAQRVPNNVNQDK